MQVSFYGRYRHGIDIVVIITTIITIDIVFGGPLARDVLPVLLR
jgi:hypothetical protein